jgi:hypothetical protein
MVHVNSTFDAVYVHDQVLEDDTSKYNTGAATGDESLKNSQRDFCHLLDTDRQQLSIAPFGRYSMTI